MTFSFQRSLLRYSDRSGNPGVKFSFLKLWGDLWPDEKQSCKKDNHKRGSVGQFLIDSIKPHADLSVVSAYFTIYAYNQLKDQLDRIGSRNIRIQLVNFWPTKDLDNYINLKERVEARMALVDVTATGKDNILNTAQIEELIEEDLKFRNRQLKKLKDEVLDLEDMSESVSLTDFTLDDFRIELMNFMENNRKKLQEAPFGLYAVVPSPSGTNSHHLESNRFSAAEKEIIKPGVVYCLKQKGDTGGNEEINPLQPYFLVYIREDGIVRFNYTNAKQILEIYRLMCQGRKEPFEELCGMFNTETKQGKDMEKYAGLLRQAIEEICRVFKKRSAQKLTSDRGALLIPKSKQINDMNNFELVTWLVIK